MRLLATLAMVLVPVSTIAAAGEVITGPARVIDGDTLEVAGARVMQIEERWSRERPNCRRSRV